jgi:alanine-glyoxylate transaminase/serine-glyoxylate transaminase/serine-pyruvate transaminase
MPSGDSGRRSGWDQVPLRGRIFRIGHLASLNELELLGAIGGLERALKTFGVPLTLGSGIAAAADCLLSAAA